jgi:hypothetical protein
MNEILQNPVFQSVIVPFLVALIVAELFQRMRLSGLAVIAAFCSVLILTNDLVFWPLTATRKLIVVAFFVTVVALWLDSARKLPRLAEMAIVAVFAGLATLWILWPAFMQVHAETRMLFMGGVILFVVWTVVASESLQGDSVRASTVAWGLGMASGLVAWIGSSSLLGKFGITVAMASAAYLFIHVVSGLRLPTGRIFIFLAAMITALVSATAVVLDKLPWMILPVLAFIPLMVRLPLGKDGSVRSQSVLLGALVLLPAVAAVYLIWQIGGINPLTILSK